jgi:hypothetical protein
MRHNPLLGALFFAIAGIAIFLTKLGMDHFIDRPVPFDQQQYSQLSDFGEWKLLFGTPSDDDINEWRQLYGAFLDAPDYSEGTSAIIWATTNPYSVQYGGTCSMNTGFTITSTSGSGATVFINRSSTTAY